jgi:hypothetical protein
MARIDLAALKTAIHPQKNAEGHRSSFRGAMRRVRDRSVLFCEFLWMYFGMVCAHRLPTRRPGDDSFYPCRVCRAGGLEPVARSKLEDRIVSRKGAKAQRRIVVWVLCDLAPLRKAYLYRISVLLASISGFEILRR